MSWLHQPLSGGHESSCCVAAPYENLCSAPAPTSSYALYNRVGKFANSGARQLWASAQSLSTTESLLHFFFRVINDSGRSQLVGQPEGYFFLAPHSWWGRAGPSCQDARIWSGQRGKYLVGDEEMHGCVQTWEIANYQNAWGTTWFTMFSSSLDAKYQNSHS